MTEWTNEELARADTVDEVQISSVRDNATMSKPRTIWVVRDGQDLYVRSVNGPDAAWFRSTRARHEGRVQIGDVERNVSFVDADQSVNDQIDAAYQSKYRRYDKSIVDSVNSPQARSTTMKILPH